MKGIHLTGEQALISLAVLAVGLVYASWFKRTRGALGFIWLIWVTLGVGAAGLAGLAGHELRHDLSRVVMDWAPWNYLLLALIPPLTLRGPGTAALVVVLVLQLCVPLLLADAATWNEMPMLNEFLIGYLPEAFRPSDALAPFMVLVALCFFVRWQKTDRPIELALFIIVTALLAGLLKASLLFPALLVGALCLTVAVLYSSHRMAFVDALTGVRNRRSLEAALEGLGRNYAIAMLDIDHFKRVNDRFGHEFGDQVLRAVAARVKRIKGFRLFRYGGEEFCLLFTGRTVDSAAELCEAVREAVAERPIAMRSQGRPERKPLAKGRYREKVPSVKTSVSIGLAHAGEKFDSPQAVREAADKALYRAKKAGRNRVSVSRG